jgi:quaternary ammonium compound-resistance protein SugE
VNFDLTPRTAWLLLVVAGIFEIVWALGLKYTQGFTRPLPTLATVAAMGISFFLLAQALRLIPVGTAYAVWTGIGAVGTVLCGILFFAEPAGFWRVFCILLIVGGIFGLKLASPG